MRLRKAEREQLVAALEADHASAEDAAAATFEVAARMLLERDWWVLCVAQPGSLMAYGPYATRLRALRACPALEYRSPEARVWVRRLAAVEADLLGDEDA